MTGLLQIQIGNLIQPSNTTGIVVPTQVPADQRRVHAAERRIASVQHAMARRPVQATVYDQSGTKSSTSARCWRSTTLAPRPPEPFSSRRYLRTSIVSCGGRSSMSTSRPRSSQNALTIPTNALQQNDNGNSSMWSATTRGSVRPVEVTQRLHAVALISKGLQAGETVVVQGQYRLTPGPSSWRRRHPTCRRRRASPGMLL